MSGLKLYLSHVPLVVFFFQGSTALVGRRLLVFEASWWHC